MTQIHFLDQLGRELDGAAGRLIREQRRARYRGLLAPAAALAAAAAVAVAVWPSPSTDPEREAAAPVADRSPSQILGILRRPESEADRSAATEGARRAVDQLIEGEPVIRLLGVTPEGWEIVLAAGPIAEGYADDATPGEDGVCTWQPINERGATATCWTVDDITGARAWDVMDDRLRGLAPDGAVEARVSNGREQRTGPVRDNFFQVEIAGLEPISELVLVDERGRPVARDEMPTPEP